MSDDRDCRPPTGYITDLFATTESPFPDWLPNETLFSLVSRQHAMSGRGAFSATSEQLFGHARGGYQHDFPTRLFALLDVVGERLGSATEIIREHTIAHFFVPFRGASAVDEIHRAMLGDGSGSLKFRLGLLTSRVRANHPLKACRECMADDRHKFGAAYWHRDHQLPGVWVCEIHRSYLLSTRLKTSGIERFGWCLPDDAHLIPGATSFDGSRGAGRFDSLLALARAARQLIELPVQYYFDPHTLGVAYRDQLTTLGLVTGRGRLKLPATGALMETAAENFGCIPELQPTSRMAEQLTEALARVVAFGRRPTHTLRHLQLAVTCFGQWETFVASYDRAVQWLANSDDQETAAQAPLDLSGRVALAEKRQQLIDTVRTEKTSIRQAALRFGVDWITAKVWVTSAGIDSGRRPKQLKLQNRTELIHRLRAGHEKAIIAKELGISVQTVTTTLRTEVGLHDSWSQARYADAQRDARTAWLSAQTLAPASGVLELRRSASAAYAWLYRNDCDWLRSHSPVGRVRTAAPTANVQWDERDTALAQLVAAAALALVQSMTVRSRLTIGMLCAEVPSLRPRLSQLARLPLTATALRQACRKASPEDATNQLI